MRIGLAGKGGVGKSTVAALLADTWHRDGRRVLMVDTDADPGLGLLLGLDLDAVEDAPMLPRDIVVGHGDGRRSPAELIDGYGIVTPAGPVLLHAGSVTTAGAGCGCGAHTSVRSLLGASLDREADVAIVDVAAGLESLSRASGTLAYADVLLVVTTPTRKAMLTTARTRDLAEELGIPRVLVVGNRVRDERDTTMLEGEIEDHALDLVASIPHEPSVAAAERDGRALDPGPLQDTFERLVDVVGEAGERRAALRRKRERIDRRLADLRSREVT